MGNGRHHTGPGDEPVHDAIIVAGAPVTPDGTPSRPLRRRAVAGVERYLAGDAPLLLFSGGRVGQQPRSEAEAGADIAREMGVPRQSIVVETQAKNTWENAKLSANLVDARRVLVVTDDYHLRRCLVVFGRFFHEVSGWGCPTPRLERAAMAARELVALAHYRWTGRI